MQTKKKSATVLYNDGTTQAFEGGAIYVLHYRQAGIFSSGGVEKDFLTYAGDGPRQLILTEGTFRSVVIN